MKKTTDTSSHAITLPREKIDELHKKMGKTESTVTNDANDSNSSIEEKKDSDTVPTQKEKGLKLFKQQYSTWYNQLNQPGVSKGKENYLLNEYDFLKDFHQSYLSTNSEALSSQNWQALQKEFRNICLFESQSVTTYKRIALLEDMLVYDHCNAARQVTVITESGWKITDQSPVKFVRTHDMSEQCLPAEKGNINALDPFLNVNYKWESVCIKAAIFKCFIPTLPNPIIGLFGDQGSGKTFALEAIMQIVCPSIGSMLMSMPSSDAALLNAANDNCCAFDNVSVISDKQADAFCKISTGIRRDLHLSSLKSGIEFPTISSLVFLNGINNVFLRPDLADRAIPIYMRKIEAAKRKSVKDLWQLFNNAKPSIIAGIFDGISSYLRNKDKVQLDAPPRMMDFAIAVTAAEEGFGWEKALFMKSYSAAIKYATQDSLELNPIAWAIIGYMRSRGTEKTVELTVMKWLDLLKTRTEKEKFSGSIPSNPKALSQEIFRLKPQLEMMGIFIERVRTSRDRTIKISCPNKKVSYGSVEAEGLEYPEDSGREAEAEMAETALNAENLKREDTVLRNFTDDND